jgi:hypothetical protein
MGERKCSFSPCYRGCKCDQHGSNQYFSAHIESSVQKDETKYLESSSLDFIALCLEAVLPAIHVRRIVDSDKRALLLPTGATTEARREVAVEAIGSKQRYQNEKTT